MQAFTYRFKIYQLDTGETIGSGSFKVARELTENEQLAFLHQYTHGIYEGKESLLSIDIDLSGWDGEPLVFLPNNIN